MSEKIKGLENLGAAMQASISKAGDGDADKISGGVSTKKPRKSTAKPIENLDDGSYFGKISNFANLSKAIESSKGIYPSIKDQINYVIPQTLHDKIYAVRKGEAQLDEIPEAGGLRQKVKALMEIDPSKPRRKFKSPEIQEAATLKPAEALDHDRQIAKLTALIQEMLEMNKKILNLKDTPVPPALPPTPIMKDKGIKDAFDNKTPATSDSTEIPKNTKEFKGFDIDKDLRENDKVVLRNTLRNRGPEEMQKLQKVLRDKQQIRVANEADLNKIKDPEKLKYAKGLDERFKKIEETQNKAMPHAEKMYASERAYLTALKEFHKKRGFASVTIDKFTNKEVELPKDVRDLKDNWMKSRAEYAAYMKQSAIDRLKEKGKSDEYIEKALGKYERGTVLREVIFGATEAEQNARIEGLKSREKKFVERQFEKFGNLSKPKKILIGAALMGGLGTLAAAGGSVVGLLGTVMAVPSAFYAIRAMFTKDQAKKDIYANRAAGFAKWTIGGIFGRAGEAATRKGHKFFKTEEKANDRLKLSDRSGVGNLSDSANISKISGSRSEDLRSKEKIEVQARQARLLSALIGGAVVGGALAEYGPHIDTNFAGASVFAGLGHHVGAGSNHLSIGEHVGHTNINDGERLLGHFAEKMRVNHLHSTGPEPLAVQKLYGLLHAKGHTGLLSSTGESKAAVSLGFEGRDGSVIMQPGDTISLHHNEIVIDRPGDPSMHHVLIHKDGRIDKLTTEKWPQPLHNAAKPHEVASGSHDATQHTPESSPSTSSDYGDIKLNNDEHARDLQQIIANQKVQNDYNALVAEHAKATEAYGRGLHTAADQHAYKTYETHYNEYMSSHPRGVEVQPRSETTIPASAPRIDVVPVRPIPEVTNTVPQVSPEVTPTTHEAPAANADTLTNLHNSINTLRNDSGWAEIRNAKALDVLTITPNSNEQAQILFRNEFIDVVRNAGVQPAPGQAVWEYIDQVNK